MKKIGIVVKADREARKKAEELEKWLDSRNVDIIKIESSPPNRGKSEIEDSLAPADLYCVFVLGGDGTFLSAVRWIGNYDIPILGVKFGDVGFLAETVEDRLLEVAQTILNEDFVTQARMRLLVRVNRREKERAAETVLNDVVINKGALARLASIETHINGLYLTAYRADGLIVATPTGSTAYSLAAGGPVIHPAVPAIIMTPICPFTLTNRPLIIPDSSVIKLKLEKGSSDIQLTFDGQKGLDIDDKDTIIINKSVHPIRTITLPDQDYFDILKAKLRWSGGRV